MGADILYATLATGRFDFGAAGGLARGIAEEHHHTRPGLSWQRRASKTWRDRNAFVSAWPRSGLMGAEGTGETDMMGDQDGYEPFSCDGDGCQKKHSIRGTCRDSSDVVVANAIVQGFRTSDDAFVGEVTGGNDGTFTVLTENSKATPHYLVAYKAGGGDIFGTTVNTILPTEVDGTA